MLLVLKRTLAYCLIFLLITGCGGSGGSSTATNDADDQDITYAAKQNTSAKQYIDDASILASAFKKGADSIAAYLGEDWEEWDWTGEELSWFLTEEEIDSLLTELQTLIKNDIVPTADSFKTASDEIINTENNLNLSSNLVEDNLVQPFITGGEVLVVLTVFAFVAGAAIGATEAVNQTSSMPEGTMRERADKIATTIKVWPGAALEAIKGVISTGVEEVSSWATGTAGYKKTTITIKVGSAIHSGVTVHNALGIKRCDKPQSQDFQNIPQLQAIDTNDLLPNDIYIGRSDDNGVFHNIPEGEWTFVSFENGYIRGITACYDISGPEDIAEIEVEMDPIEEGSVDPPDEGACNESSGIYVWYVNNLPLKDVFVTSCEAYVSEEALCGYQGGGLDCSITAEKILIGSGYETSDDAVRTTCSSVSDIGPCGSTWFCGWLGYIGGQRHVIDGLGGCQ